MRPPRDEQKICTHFMKNVNMVEEEMMNYHHYKTENWTHLIDFLAQLFQVVFSKQLPRKLSISFGQYDPLK